MASLFKIIKRKKVQFQGASDLPKSKPVAPDFMEDVRNTSESICARVSGYRVSLPIRLSIQAQRTVSRQPFTGDWTCAPVQGRELEGSVLDEDEARQTTPGAETVDTPPKKSEIDENLSTDNVQQAGPGYKSQSQLESDADAKQRRINRVFMNLEIAEKVPSL